MMFLELAESDFKLLPACSLDSSQNVQECDKY